jgi:hypothetical protein
MMCRIEIINIEKRFPIKTNLFVRYCHQSFVTRYQLHDRSRCEKPNRIRTTQMWARCDHLVGIVITDTLFPTKEYENEDVADAVLTEIPVSVAVFGTIVFGLVRVL